MFTVPLPRIGTWEAWRDAARALLAARVPPEQIVWDWDGTTSELFATDIPPPTTRKAIKVPADFVQMAQWVVWHKDPQRFARLYALLWRLRLEKGIMTDRADAELSRLRQMEKAVHRCKHKMRAFVRFRDLRTGGARRSFAAWFEPTHHTVEPCAPFFARRFADMDWMIVTPNVTAKFTDGDLTFHEGLQPCATEDIGYDVRDAEEILEKPARGTVHPRPDRHGRGAGPRNGRRRADVGTCPRRPNP
jgi:probable DNA metabolism protein